jgi:hypothetical protein
MDKTAVSALVLVAVAAGCVHRAGSAPPPAQEAAAAPPAASRPAAADTGGFVCVVEGDSLRLLPTHVDAQTGTLSYEV